MGGKKVTLIILPPIEPNVKIKAPIKIPKVSILYLTAFSKIGAYSLSLKKDIILSPIAFIPRILAKNNLILEPETFLGCGCNALECAKCAGKIIKASIRETVNADLPLAVDHFRYFAGVIRAEEGFNYDTIILYLFIVTLELNIEP